MAVLQQKLLPRYDDATDRSYVTRNTNITLIICSSTIVMGRLYTRRFISNSLGMDDWVSLIALIFLVATGSLELDALNYGMGRQIADVDQDDLEKFFQTLPTFQLLTFTAIFFIRLSGLLFIRRLISNLKAGIGLWFAVAALTVQHCIFFCVFLFQCRPVRALWIHDIPRTCMSRTAEAHLMYSHSGVGIACDIALFIVPMAFVWKHIWNHKMRFRIALLLSVGSFVCIAGIIRLSIIVTVDMGTNTTCMLAFAHHPTPLKIPTDLLSNNTGNITYAAMWTQLECHTGLIMSCFPALNPVFRLIKRKVTGGSMTSDFSGVGRQRGYPKPGSGLELYAVGGLPSERRNNIVRGYPECESQEKIMPDVIHKSTNIEVSIENVDTHGIAR